MPVSLEEEEAEPRALPVTREAWIALAAGLILALALPWFPFLSFILHPIQTITHELGHTAFLWLFGYPAIPAFDFEYGGGLTSQGTRILAICFVPAGFCAWMAARAWPEDRPRVAAWAGLLGLYLLANSRWRTIIMLYMGHGLTLCLAGVFLYRALSGRSVFHSVERALYAMIGFWMVFRETRFAYDLLTNPGARMLYREGKGGIPNDFVRISEDLHVSLASVSRLHLGACVATLALSFVVFRYREFIANFLRWIFGLKLTES